MKKIRLFILLPLTLVVVAGCSLSPTAKNLTANKATSTGTTSTLEVNAQTKVKLSDSPDAGNAFLISGDSLSAEATQALTGFTINKQIMPDGTTKITLTAIDPEYKNQEYTLEVGQSLYFIDRSLRDDNSQEANIGDDFGIITDSDGYIISSIK